MTYGSLAQELGLRMADLTAALETLMEEDSRAGRPLRAALLCQRLSSSGQPAPGFFAKAETLGRLDIDAETERRALFAATRTATSAP